MFSCHQRCYSYDCSSDTLIVISTTEMRDKVTISYLASHSVRDKTFGPITCFNSYPPVFYRNQYQCSFIILRTDTPFTIEVVSKEINIFFLQIGNNCYRYLKTGLLFQLCDNIEQIDPGLA